MNKKFENLEKLTDAEVETVKQILARDKKGRFAKKPPKTTESNSSTEPPEQSEQQTEPEEKPKKTPKGPDPLLNKIEADLIEELDGLDFSEFETYDQRTRIQLFRHLKRLRTPKNEPEQKRKGTIVDPTAPQPDSQMGKKTISLAKKNNRAKFRADLRNQSPILKTMKKMRGLDE